MDSNVRMHTPRNSWKAAEAHWSQDATELLQQMHDDCKQAMAGMSSE